MKKKIIVLSVILCGVVLLILSSVFLFYPQINKTIVNSQQSKSIEQYETDLKKLNQEESRKNKNPVAKDKGIKSKKRKSSTTNHKANLKHKNNQERKKITLNVLREKIKKYNKKIYNEGQGTLTESSYSKAPFSLYNYKIKSEVYGYIKIPKINLKMPIYLGCNNDTLAKGAAQLSGTSIPYGGKNTNTVIAGHCGYGYSDYFRYLDKLEEGDRVIIKTPFKTLKYIAKKKKIIKPRITDDMLIHTGKDMVTLFTCHPYPTNKYRLCVFCERK